MEPHVRSKRVIDVLESYVKTLHFKYERNLTADGLHSMRIYPNHFEGSSPCYASVLGYGTGEYRYKVSSVFFEENSSTPRVRILGAANTERLVLALVRVVFSDHEADPDWPMHDPIYKTLLDSFDERAEEGK